MGPLITEDREQRGPSQRDEIEQSAIQRGFGVTVRPEHLPRERRVVDMQNAAPYRPAVEYRAVLAGHVAHPPVRIGPHALAHVADEGFRVGNGRRVPEAAGRGRPPLDSRVEAGREEEGNGEEAEHEGARQESCEGRWKGRVGQARCITKWAQEVGLGLGVPRGRECA